MTKDEVLTQLNEGKITIKKAYKTLFKPNHQKKPRRASFVKVHIKTSESRAVNIFLGIILLLPVPIFMIKWILKKRSNQVISDQFQMSTTELIELISLRGVKVDILTNSKERVLIKTI